MQEVNLSVSGETQKVELLTGNAYVEKPEIKRIKCSVSTVRNYAHKFISDKAVIFHEALPDQAKLTYVDDLGSPNRTIVEGVAVPHPILDKMRLNGQPWTVKSFLVFLKSNQKLFNSNKEYMDFYEKISVGNAKNTKAISQKQSASNEISQKDILETVESSFPKVFYPTVPLIKNEVGYKTLEVHLQISLGNEIMISLFWYEEEETMESAFEDLLKKELRGFDDLDIPWINGSSSHI